VAVNPFDTADMMSPLQAVTAYQRAIRLQPNFPEAYNNLGNTLRELGRADEAIACYTACIQLQYAQQHAAGVNMAQVLPSPVF
jgi:Flp pilus assembly protein TadD